MTWFLSDITVQLPEFQEVLTHVLIITGVHKAGQTSNTEQELAASQPHLFLPFDLSPTLRRVLSTDCPDAQVDCIDHVLQIGIRPDFQPYPTLQNFSQPDRNT